MRRVLKNSQLSECNCVGMDEMIPCRFKDYNAEFQTYPHTYYFAHATGERKKIREKAREILHEPKKLSLNACGFNTEITDDLKFRNTTQKLQRRESTKPITFFEQALSAAKMASNLLSVIMKLHFDNFHGTKWDLNYLDNRLNANMNNLMAIDHAARDWLDDTDYLLPRTCTEFPRLSEGYKTKSAAGKPWGLIKEPVYIEPFLDEN